MYQWRICCSPMWVRNMCGMGVPIIGGRVELLCYFSHSERVSCSTSSHRCDRLILVRFLLREESLDSMYMASLIVLVDPYASLSVMLKHSRSIWSPVVWLCIQMGDGVLRCFLNLSPKVLPDSPMYCSGQSVCEHL